MAKELLKSWTKKDFKLEWFSGTGAGGQHRNKHQNCCRITHIESGMMETGQNHKVRSQNQKEAFKRLAHRVVKAWQDEQTVVRLKNEEVIRSYNEPDNRVKDHDTGIQIAYSDLDKNIDNLITERLISKTRKEHHDDNS